MPFTALTSSVSRPVTPHWDGPSLQRFSELIGLIYDAALHAEAWPEVPKAICAWMDANVGVIFTPLDPFDQGGFAVTHNLGLLARDLWGAVHRKDDIWTRRGVERGLLHTGETVRDQELATVEEFVATESYQTWFQPLQIGRLLTTVVFGMEQRRMPPVVCSVHRPLDQPFTEEERARYALLNPHLSRSLGVMYQLRESDLRLATTLSALDLLDRAVLLLDRQGGIFYANPMARSVMERGDGLRLVSRQASGSDTELGARDPAFHQALSQVLQEAVRVDALHASHFSEAVRVPRDGAEDPYVVQVSPLASGNGFGHGATAPAAIVFIDDAAPSPSFDERVFQQQFHLTDGEMRVVAQALGGGSVADMAIALRVSENTVKTHLKRVYDKVGVSSRAQLVRLAMAVRAQVHATAAVAGSARPV